MTGPRIILALLVTMVAVTMGSWMVTQVGWSGLDNLSDGEPVRISISIVQRKVDPSQAQIRVTQGDVVELTFSSDEPAELHLHGYDKMPKLEANQSELMRIEAKIAGRFSLEAHTFGESGATRRHIELLALQVYPR
jgi:hypothetical protein